MTMSSLTYIAGFSVLKKCLFLVKAAILNGGWAVGHNFERDPPRDHPCQVWFNLVQPFQRRKLRGMKFKKNLLL
jgi:hypothetical protein